MMRLIQWLSKLLAGLISRKSADTNSTAFRPRLRRLKIVLWVMCAGFFLSMGSETALAQQEDSSGTIAAAGFGYQIGETSTITVKVYDAATGAVLSDETFDLNVKEDNSTQSTSSPRIFAGGVSLGATDLSNFVLRVYDASTGAFQWEGQLNLSPKENPGSGHLVSTLVPRRATVTRIHAPGRAERQPLFLLRSLDSFTGGLVWEDEFSTDGRKLGRYERVAQRGIGVETGDGLASRTFDFSIRVFEADGRTMVWKDQFAQTEAQSEPTQEAEEHAQLLQAWPEQFKESAPPAEI
jgi:hypothetical protein